MAIDPKYPRSLAHRTASELLTYPPGTLAQLRYHWPLWALPHQLPPHDDWDILIWYGGRGGGKSHAASQWVKSQVEAGVERIGLVGGVIKKVRNDMVRGPAGVLSAFPPGTARFIGNESRVVVNGGASELLLETAQRPDNLRSGGFTSLWLDEFSTYADPEEVLNQALFSAREGDPRIVITTNTRPHCPFLEDLVKEAETNPRIVAIHCSSFANFNNLTKRYQDRLLAKANTKLGRAEVWGEFWKPEGALWSDDDIKYRPAPLGGLTILGLDPAGTGDEKADTHGIVIVRRVIENGRPVAYVLDDKSFRGSVEKWPEVVAAACKTYGVTEVVAERSRGLDYIRAMLQPALTKAGLRGVTIHEVNAGRESKGERAEPIHQFYQLGQVVHDHVLSDLEGEMKTFSPVEAEERRSRKQAASPDRLDALVYSVRHCRLERVRGLVAPTRNIPQPTRRI